METALLLIVQLRFQNYQRRIGVGDCWKTLLNAATSALETACKKIAKWKSIFPLFIPHRNGDEAPPLPSPVPSLRKILFSQREELSNNLFFSTNSQKLSLKNRKNRETTNKPNKRKHANDNLIRNPHNFTRARRAKRPRCYSRTILSWFWTEILKNLTRSYLHILDRFRRIRERHVKTKILLGF